MDSEGGVRGLRAWDRADVWINSGFFLLRPKIFEFMREGEELVVEPFERLAKANALIAYRHEGFFRSMDTLKDRQVLEDMVEEGKMPWRLGNTGLTRKKR
jgi:glucose-1-phosphate cytidylyltransferase